MKVYHYANHLKWGDIKRGSWLSKNRPGLAAGFSLGRRDIEARNTFAVFALLEPKPVNWTENPYFKKVWDHLKNNIGSLLLEIEVDPEKDSNVYVVDRAHPEGFLYLDKTDIPEKYLHKDLQTAEQAYVLNKIPINNYVGREKEYGLALPEVIIIDHVPFDKLSVSVEQPLLEENLVCNYEMIMQLERIPELNAWCERYRERHPELEEFRDSGLRM